MTSEEYVVKTLIETLETTRTQAEEITKLKAEVERVTSILKALWGMTTKYTNQVDNTSRYAISAYEYYDKANFEVFAKLEEELGTPEIRS